MFYYEDQPENAEGESDEFSKRRKYVTIYWPMVRNGLLKNSSKYRTMAASSAMDKANRDPKAVSDEKVKERLFQKMKEDGVLSDNDAFITSFAAFDMTDRIKGYAVDISDEE